MCANFKDSMLIMDLIVTLCLKHKI